MTLRSLSLALLPLPLLFAAPAFAKDDKKDDVKAEAQKDAKEDAKDRDDETEGDNGFKRAGRVVTQPGRDVGIDKKKVPPVLARSTESPYAVPKGGCRAITAEMVELNTAIGPDFGSDTKTNENRTGQILEAGGSAIVNTLIPFRGLVREVSGAAGAERRYQAALSTGLARRGYLRGVAQSKGCKLPG